MDQQPKHSLPILDHKKQIIDLIQHNKVTIICGETGCGKTTQVPQYLYPYYSKILITQPRRISAITLAQRMCYEMGYKLGQEIGYCVRFEEKRSAKTKIIFMTDGMAIRELMTGRTFDIFILDEAHERSINTDVLMALLRSQLKSKSKTNLNKNEKNSKKSKSSDFKVVIMSATIQSDKFMQFFQSESIVRIKGRTFPTQIYNIFQPVQNYLQATFNTILQIHNKQLQGDILAFLTGQQQILYLHKKLNKIILEFSVNNLQILMLYSALPHQYQHSIFLPNQNNKRRVILATNIAETSITINGLRYVIDPGFMKIRLYDTIKNIDMLSVVPISKANALQRAGRAGRQAPGKCFRLYTKSDHDELQQQIIPEILRSQLTGPILQLKAIGVPKIKDLQFMDQPSTETITSSLLLLHNLKCINDIQQITPYGLQVSKIPLIPYLSSLLIQSFQQKCHSIMINVLSILSIDNLFYVTKNNTNKNNSILQILKKYLPILDNSHLYSDHLTKANILQQYILCSNKKYFCHGNFININNIKRAVLIREQLKQYLSEIVHQRSKKQFIPLTNCNGNKIHQQNKFILSNQSIANWLKCMHNGSVNNIAKLNKEGNYTIQNSGQIANIHPQSLLFLIKPKPQLIVFYQVIKTAKLYLRDITALPFTK